MARVAVFTCIFALLSAPTWGEEPPSFSAPPAPARISLSWVQGFAFLDGGYADAGRYYSYYWDTGQTWSVHAALDIFPLLRAGLNLTVREHEDRGFGIDDLHAGHARLTGALRLPLTLPARFLAEPKALPAVRGPVVFLRLEAGLGVIDPTSGAFGGFYERTFTYSVSASAGMEYRLAELGLFFEFGVDLLGPPRPSAGFSAKPDPILAFPIAIGLRLYLP